MSDTRWVLVVRHPDYCNEYTTDPGVAYVDIDLGNAFTGKPGDGEAAMDWLGEQGPTYLDAVPVGSPVFVEAMLTLRSTLEDFEDCLVVLDAYEARRGLAQ